MKTLICLGIRLVWSESSLSAWRKLGSLATYWAHNGNMQPFTILFCSCLTTKWAASWQNQQNGMCAQRRLRSAWASAQSDHSLLCAQWVAKDPRFLHADSEDSDQTGRMPRLIWVFAGRTTTLLVLSWGGSNSGRWHKCIQTATQIFSFLTFRSKCASIKAD